MTDKRAINITILASGSGSNAERLITVYRDDPTINVGAVITNNKEAGVIERCERLGVPCRILTASEVISAEFMNPILREYSTDVVVLAGYLKLIPNHTIRRWSGRIINIHPSLLPKYGGRGMYGMRVHRAVIENGETVSGITVHHVNEIYDDGQIIEQQSLTIEPGWTADDLASAINKLEHEHFPRIIKELCQKLRLQD